MRPDASEQVRCSESDHGVKLLSFAWDVWDKFCGGIFEL